MGVDVWIILLFISESFYLYGKINKYTLLSEFDLNHFRLANFGGHCEQTIRFVEKKMPNIPYFFLNLYMEASWLFNDLFILKPACYFQNAIETKSTRQQQNENKRKYRICSKKMLSERDMSQNILMKFSKYVRCSM